MPWALTLTKLMVLDKDLDIYGLYVLNKSNKGIRCALTSSLTVWREWPVGTPASCSFPRGQSTSHSAWSLSDCISHFSEWSSSLGQLPRSHLLKENVKEHETRVGSGKGGNMSVWSQPLTHECHGFFNPERKIASRLFCSWEEWISKENQRLAHFEE